MPLTIERCPDIAAAERRLSEALRDYRADQPLARVNILVASGLQRLYHQRRLARQLGPLAALYFFTPADLAREIADRADTPKRDPLPPGAAPLLLDDLLHKIAGDGGLRELRADSPGLADALAVTFTDLREGGVAAQEFAQFADARPANADDRGITADLAALYSAWRRSAAKLRDRPSLYEDALSPQVRDDDIAAALGDGPLIVAGMYDFTRVQRQLLARCAQSVEVRVLFPSPPGDEHARRLADILAKETDAQQQDAPVAQPSDADVDGFSTSDPRAEAAETARRVIDAAVKQDEHGERGVRFHEMAVLHRGGAAADARIVDALKRAGAPVFIAGGQPVLHTNAGRAALRLIELLCDTPQRGRLLEFLGNPALRRRLPNGAPPKPLQWERVSRNAGLTSDWAEFHSHLERRIETLERDDSDRAYEQQAARELLQICDDLHERAQTIADADDWSGAVETILEAVDAYIDDGSGATDERNADELDQNERDGHRRLIDAIRAAVSALSGIQRIGADYSADRLRRAALSGLGKARLRPRKSFQGVLIGNAAGAIRTLRFDAVFVPGMAERSFPAAPRQDPLLTDGVRRDLNRQLGAEALRLGQSRTPQDRLAFALIAQAARRRLTLSYARRAAAVGGPAHPSVLLMHALDPAAPLLNEQSLNENDHFRRIPAAVSEAAPGPDDDGLPQWGPEQRAIDDSDLRLALLAAPGVHGPDLLRAIGGETALRADHARLGRNNGGFSAFDGVIQPPGDRWNPYDGETVLSATALERYAACPYRFFLANVLRLRAVEEPEEGGELSALDRGSLMHDILEQWVKLWLREHPQPWPDYVNDPQPLLDVAQQRLQEAQDDRKLGGPGIRDGLRRQVLDDLEQARQAEAARAAREPDWWPRAVESEFKDVELNVGGERTIKVAGRIDRIDEAPGDRRRAIDYKTGKQRRNAADAFRAGSTLQLPLYLYALDQRDGGLLAESSSELVYITRKGGFAREPLHGADLAARGAPDAPTPADELANVLAVIAEGIAGGRFFPFPFKTARKDLRDTHCKWCQFETACNPDVGRRYLHKHVRQPALTADFETLVAQRSI